MIVTFMYRFYDALDDLLYVGITVNPNQRFEAHSKYQPWWCDVARHEFEEVPTATADAIERAAIKRLHPRYNVTHNQPETMHGFRPHGYPPSSFFDAGEFLTADHAMHLLKLSRWQLSWYEANDPAFPQRLIPWNNRGDDKFFTADLRRWASKEPAARPVAFELPILTDTRRSLATSLWLMMGEPGTTAATYMAALEQVGPERERQILDDLNAAKAEAGKAEAGK